MSQVVSYNSKVYASGTTTSFTAEPTTQIGASKSYQINTSVKRILDPSVTPTIKISGSPVAAANIASIDLYFGIVTFISTYSPAGAPTVDGSYLPIISVADLTQYAVTGKVDMLDTSVIGGGAAKTKQAGMYDVSGSITGLDPFSTVIDSSASVGNKSFWDWFGNGTPKLLEIDPDGGGTYVFRAWVLFESISSKAATAALIDRSYSFQGAQQKFALSSGLTVLPASWGAP